MRWIALTEHRLRRSARPLICAGLLLLPVYADQANNFYKRGRAAEARKDYDNAFLNYRQASDLKPANLDYQLAARRARFEASMDHVRRGQMLRAQGRMPGALDEFQKALAFDPTNVVAAQEIRQIREEAAPAARQPGQPVTRAAESAIDRRLARAAEPMDLGPVSTTPINNFMLTGDSRVAYDTLGKIAGLNVIYDSDYRGLPVRLELNNVTLLEALRILGIEARSFYTVVTPNTIFVASDTADKRNQVQEQVVKTFYLHNISQAGDLSEVTQAIRGVLNINRVQPVLSQMALVVRDTPDRVAVVQKILDDLDKAPPEVIVDVEVLEVSRSLLRDLGLLPPTSTTIGLQTYGTTPSTTTTTTGTTTTNPVPPTLNYFTHLSGKNFSVTVTPAQLNLLLSDSNTKTLQAPQLRALQAKKASLKIGSRIPTATGSFGAGLGIGGAGGFGGGFPLVNTQFQYLDVGVNMDLTPFIHGDDQVGLQTKIEISSVVDTVNIGGISQPVIGQRIVDLGMIQLRDGESNVLGGIIENTDVHNMSGIPGLSAIPGLKWLFSTTHTERREDEVLIVMTPHIVRQSDITAFNRKVLDTGTVNTVELHQLPPATAVGAPQPRTQPGTRPVTPLAPLPQPGVTAAPPGLGPAGPGAAVTPGAPVPVPGAQTPPAVVPGPGGVAAPPPLQAQPVVPAGSAALRFDPATLEGVVGNPFGVNLILGNANAAYAISLQLNYDPRMIEVQNISNAGFLSSDGQAIALVPRDDPATGTAQITVSRPPNVAGISGSGAVLAVTLRAKAAGTTMLSVSRVIARNPQGVQIPVQVSQATVQIR